MKNGDTWEVTRRHDDQSLSVRHLGHRGEVQLPPSYVADCVELAYARTAHRTQDSTVDTAHALVTGDMTRESLYVASTRGLLRSGWYVATEGCSTSPATMRVIHRSTPPVARSPRFAVPLNGTFRRCVRAAVFV